MKLYIVTEKLAEDNTLLRTWVCFSKEEADECLKNRYQIACTYNRISETASPIDCTELGFFFWEMGNGMRMKYSIENSQTFAE